MHSDKVYRLPFVEGLNMPDGRHLEKWKNCYISAMD